MTEDRRLEMIRKVLGLFTLFILVTGCTPEPVIETVVETVVHTQQVTKEVMVTTTPEPTTTPTSMPALIFEEDFESGPGEWGTTFGNEAIIQVRGGKLSISLANPDLSYWTGHPETDFLNRPYVVEVDITFVDGSPDSSGSVYPRFMDDDNFGWFSVDGDGWVSFSLIIEGEFYDVVPWIKLPAVKPGSNRFKFADDGTTLMVYGNGELLFAIPFTDLRPSSVLFGADTYETGNVTWEFDNLVVTEFD
jgi:hypothetical protein